MSDNQYQGQRVNPQAFSSSGFSGLQARTAAEASISESLGFIRKVYALFFVGILFAMGGVAISLSVPELMMAVARNYWITFILLIGGVMGAQAVRHVKGINLLALFGFTTLTGVIISPLVYVVLRNNPASLLQASILTVGIFGGL